MAGIRATWWRRRGQLKRTARDLTREFGQYDTDDLSFGVRSHGAGSLELLVRPEAGFDNFPRPVKTDADVERSADEFRSIVAKYLDGQRPSFD